MRDLVAVVLFSFFLSEALGASVLFRVLELEHPERGPVFDVLETDNGLWFATAEGTYLLKGNKPQPVNPPHASVALHERDGEVWIGTDQGLYLSRGRGSEELLFPDVIGPTRITAIESIDANVWIGGQGGLFRVDSGQNVRKLSSGKVSDLLANSENGGIWVSYSDAVIQYNSDGVVLGESSRVLESSGGKRVVVDRLALAGGTLWSTTRDEVKKRPGPCYRMVDGELEKFSDDRFEHQLEEVISIGSNKDEVVIFAKGVILNVRGEFISDLPIRSSHRRSVPTGAHEQFSSTSDLGMDGLWITSSYGTYYLKNEEFVPEPWLTKNIQVRVMESAGGDIWALATDGAYRFEPDLSICGKVVNVNSNLGVWKRLSRRLNLDHEIRVEKRNYCYAKDSLENLDYNILYDGTFQLAYFVEEKELSGVDLMRKLAEGVKGKTVVFEERERISLRPWEGPGYVCSFLRDDFGNTSLLPCEHIDNIINRFLVAVGLIVLLISFVLSILISSFRRWVVKAVKRYLGQDSS